MCELARSFFQYLQSHQVDSMWDLTDLDGRLVLLVLLRWRHCFFVQVSSSHAIVQDEVLHAFIWFDILIRWISKASRCHNVSRIIIFQVYRHWKYCNPEWESLEEAPYGKSRKLISRWKINLRLTNLDYCHRSQIQLSIDQCLSRCLEDFARRWWRDLKRKAMASRALTCQRSCNGKILDLIAAHLTRYRFCLPLKS